MSIYFDEYYFFFSCTNKTLQMEFHWMCKLTERASKRVRENVCIIMTRILLSFIHSFNIFSIWWNGSNVDVWKSIEYRKVDRLFSLLNICGWKRCQCCNVSWSSIGQKFLILKLCSIVAWHVHIEAIEEGKKLLTFYSILWHDQSQSEKDQTEHVACKQLLEKILLLLEQQ